MKLDWTLLAPYVTQPMLGWKLQFHTLAIYTGGLWCCKNQNQDSGDFYLLGSSAESLGLRQNSSPLL